jgi:hypothetical protein
MCYLTMMFQLLSLSSIEQDGRIMYHELEKVWMILMY